jgi:hypothetical protein
MTGLVALLLATHIVEPQNQKSEIRNQESEERKQVEG